MGKIKSIKILGQNININWVDTIGNTEYLGLARPDDFTVDVKKNVQPDVETLTLIHELLHIVEAITGIKLKEHEINLLSYAVRDISMQVK